MTLLMWGWEPVSTTAGDIRDQRSLGIRCVGNNRRPIPLARLRGRPRGEALRPVLQRHAFRYVGSAFLVPGVVSPDLPDAFARPAAYGELVTYILALLAIATLKSRLGTIVVWVFNIVGTLDLFNAFDRAIASSRDPPACRVPRYFIPTVLVPLLPVTHALVFRLLLATDAPAGRQDRHSTPDQWPPRRIENWNEHCVPHRSTHRMVGQTSSGHVRRADLSDGLDADS